MGGVRAPAWGVGALGLLGGVRGVLGGLAGSVATQGQEGYRWHQGALGLLGGVGGIGVASGLGAQPHWAPVQGPSTTTGSPWGMTYLVKAKQVTEMRSAGYYIHLELYLVTVCTFVYMPPNHIFLHTM